MAGNADKYTSMMFDARRETIAIGGGTAVTDHGRAPMQLLQWHVTRFTLWQTAAAAGAGEGAQRSKIIPLRRNLTNSFAATWIKPAENVDYANGAADRNIGAIGYCEDGTASVLRISAQIEPSAYVLNPVTYRVRLYSSELTQELVSNEVSVGRSGVYAFEIPGFEIPTGFSKAQMRFAWERRLTYDSTWQRDATAYVPLYNFPNRPTPPWSVEQGDGNNPWTDALDLLWDRGWRDFRSIQHDGRRDHSEVASAVTKIVNSRLGLEYGNGNTRFGETDVELTKFIQERKEIKTTKVNCVDCANLVTAFSNLLGCSLYNVTMRGDNEGFRTNRVRLIGTDYWDYPSSQGEGNRSRGFRMHEISMTGPFHRMSPIYDACLEVDRNAIINTSVVSVPVIIDGGCIYVDTIFIESSNDISAVLPQNLTFSSRSEYRLAVGKNEPQHYLEWLVLNSPEHLNNASQIQTKRELGLK